MSILEDHERAKETVHSFSADLFFLDETTYFNVRCKL